MGTRAARLPGGSSTRQGSKRKRAIGTERNGREEVSEGGREGRKQRVKEAQDKDVREGKEWGAIEENRGKGERAGESVTVACCRVRW